MHSAEGDAGVWMHSGEGVHLFPSEADVRAWRAVIEGPAASPFAGGYFSPSVRYHANVSESGQICLALLREAWNPTLSVPKALEAVRLLLGAPDTDNALRQWIAELTLASAKTDGRDSRYADAARERTRADAARSVQEAVRAWGA